MADTAQALIHGCEERLRSAAEQVQQLSSTPPDEYKVGIKAKMAMWARQNIGLGKKRLVSQRAVDKAVRQSQIAARSEVVTAVQQCAVTMGVEVERNARRMEELRQRTETAGQELNAQFRALSLKKEKKLATSEIPEQQFTRTVSASAHRTQPPAAAQRRPVSFRPPHASRHHVASSPATEKSEEESDEEA